MTFDKVLPALIAGKKIRRGWEDNLELEYVHYDNDLEQILDDENIPTEIIGEWIAKDDWGIIDENGGIISDLSEPDLADTPTDIPSDALSAWHDGYDIGYKVGKNDTLLKIRDYVNEMRK